MNFKEAVIVCFSKYATFSGRARRSEFWYYVLFINLVTFGFGLLSRDGGGLFGVLSSLFSLATLVPTLAVIWRRFHDIGMSGLRVLFACIPLVGWIFLLVWYCRDSQPGPNRFGPNPKESSPWDY